MVDARHHHHRGQQARRAARRSAHRDGPGYSRSSLRRTAKPCWRVHRAATTPEASQPHHRNDAGRSGTRRQTAAGRTTRSALTPAPASFVVLRLSGPLAGHADPASLSLPTLLKHPVVAWWLITAWCQRVR